MSHTPRDIAKVNPPRSNFDIARELAAKYAPPPAWEPVPAGVALATVTGLVLGVFAGLARISLDASPMAFLLTLMVAFLVGWYPMKRQQDKFFIAANREWERLEGIPPAPPHPKAGAVSEIAKLRKLERIAAEASAGLKSVAPEKMADLGDRTANLLGHFMYGDHVQKNRICDDLFYCCSHVTQETGFQGAFDWMLASRDKAFVEEAASIAYLFSVAAKTSDHKDAAYLADLYSAVAFMCEGNLGRLAADDQDILEMIAQTYAVASIRDSTG